MKFGNPRNKHHPQPDKEDNHRRAEVRLEQDQDERQERVKPGNENVFDISDFHVSTGEIFSEHQDQRQLHKINRLKREKAEVKPAFIFIKNTTHDDQCKQSSAHT